MKAKIKKLQKNISPVENLNNGGCGIFAANAAKALRGLGYQADIWFLGYKNSTPYSENDIENAKKLLEKNNYIDLEDLDYCNISCHHAVVELKTPRQHFLFDSVNILDLEDGCPKIKKFACGFMKMVTGVHPIPLDLFFSAVENPYGWNTFFNRDKWKTIIENTIQKSLLGSRKTVK